VHQLRIALRRLRSWIHVYRPVLDDTLRRRTTRRLRRLARATRSLRDLDVQIAWLRAERRALGDSRLEAARWVARILKTERKRTARYLKRALARDFARCERALRRELTFYVVTLDVRTTERTDSMRAVTSELLQQEAERLDRALERIRSADDTRRLHRARITAKRTRYVMEALAAQMPPLGSVADDLARFQDVVGELRDAQLLAHRVAREVTLLATVRTALVASELVYRPVSAMDFSRVVTESPFDASLALLFARLHDRLSVASRAVAASLEQHSRVRLAGAITAAAQRVGNGTDTQAGAEGSAR
jgi:CHAD domain-containing protein